ncbi:hypothetical protein GF325_16730 [Candidatus Bathyarchaeota archaeon]|nr:hypothetical protein [Candidatus Bathyarchaeota archaeon]
MKAWRFIKGTVRKYSIFFILYGNALLIMAALYVMLAPGLMDSLSPINKESVLNQISATYFLGTWVFIYPFILELDVKISKPIKIVYWGTFIKILAIIVMEMLNIFPGYNNFDTDYTYGMRYVDPSLESEIYYPPGTSLYLAFMFLINPGKSTLLFRLVNLAWETGTFLVVFEIARTKRIKKSRRAGNTLLFLTFSATWVFTNLIHSKFDMFGIFMSMVGVYFVICKKWWLSAPFLVFAGFFKIYSFLWIIGILVVLMKQKDWNSFKHFTLGSILSATLFLALFTLIEGFAFVENLLTFGWHFTVWEDLYNLNWSYYLKYLVIPGLNFLPPVLIVAAILWYLYRYQRGITLQMFANITIILLLLYPSVNFHYLVWIVPILALTYQDYKVQFSRATLVYEVIHVGIDMHSFCWFFLFGLQKYVAVDNPLITYPASYPAWLAIRFITILPFLIGLLYYMNRDPTALGMTAIQDSSIDSSKQSQTIKNLDA